MASSAWGIDIGEHSVKGVKLTRSGSDVRAVAYDRVECAAPETGEAAERDQRLLQALQAFLARNRVSGPVVVSMPEPAFNRVIPLPPVEAKRLDEIVQFEAASDEPLRHAHDQPQIAADDLVAGLGRTIFGGRQQGAHFFLAQQGAARQLDLTDLICVARLRHF